MNDLISFSATIVHTVVAEFVSKAERRYKSNDSPSAVLLAGQPGAGKTVLSELFSVVYSGDSILINGDDYRHLHPHYQDLHAAYGADAVSMTSAFSGAVTEALIDKLSDRRFNLIIEGTGRTVDVPAKTAKLLSKKGYEVRMAAIAVRPEISLACMLLRYYKMYESGMTPRATPVDAHDNIVRALPGNLDRIRSLPQIAGVSIWTRERNLIFDSERDSEAPSRVLRSQWNKPWSPSEIEDAEELARILRDKERDLRLGQEELLHEIERRFETAYEQELHLQEPAEDLEPDL